MAARAWRIASINPLGFVSIIDPATGLEGRFTSSAVGEDGASRATEQAVSSAVRQLDEGGKLREVREAGKAAPARIGI